MNESMKGARLSTCGTCYHCNKEVMQGQIMHVLVCKEGPPTMAMVPVKAPNGQMGAQGLTQFPIVHPEMWCNRWKARELPSNAQHGD